MQETELFADSFSWRYIHISLEIYSCGGFLRPNRQELSEEYHVGDHSTVSMKYFGGNFYLQIQHEYVHV